MSAAILQNESTRLVEQRRLDAQKTSVERNKLGQFATPPDLALDIAEYAWNKLSHRSGAFRFLDPAIGTGSFYSAVMQTFPKDRISCAAGIELDPAFAKTASEIWKASGLEVTVGDFTRQPPPLENDKFNLVLTNPPYVRHHHFPNEEKKRLGQLVRKRLGIKISALSGLYCYFLLLADTWLAKNGLSVWLIPSEFMDVNYGDALKHYFTDKISLLQIHRFCPSDVQFSDALVSSAIVVFEKKTPKKGHFVRFSFGGTLQSPLESNEVALSTLLETRKWTSLPNLNKKSTQNSAVTLGDLFTIKRGLATGNNSFFILPRERVGKLGIPFEFVRPIMPSPRFVNEEIIESDEFGYPISNNPLALIDCSLDEAYIKENYPKFWCYLEEGKSRDIHRGYLTSRRSPWYSQEKREPAPLMCTYMGRSKEKPFRFMWNKSKATAANVYLMLYPKGIAKTTLDENPNIYRDVLVALNTIDAAEFLGAGRVYGGGLYKIEPAELKRVHAEKLLTILNIDCQAFGGIGLQKQLSFFDKTEASCYNPTS